ncbi:hypothetical protein [Acidovorax sp. BL-A-41-H1]|uniref:hypothetical protein n=1 Tax=Acidovorax sp. BL-A-41-H1 TaxID=3421102 RepID=UPI003F7B2FDB
MSSAPARRALAEAVQALVKTNAPTTDHYEAVCKALGAVAADDMGVPVQVVLKADFSKVN